MRTDIPTKIQADALIYLNRAEQQIENMLLNNKLHGMSIEYWNTVARCIPQAKILTISLSAFFTQYKQESSHISVSSFNALYKLLKQLNIILQDDVQQDAASPLNLILTHYILSAHDRLNALFAPHVIDSLLYNIISEPYCPITSAVISSEKESAVTHALHFPVSREPLLVNALSHTFNYAQDWTGDCELHNPPASPITSHREKQKYFLSIPSENKFIIFSFMIFYQDTIISPSQKHPSPIVLASMVDLSPYTQTPHIPQWYRLVGFVSHIGTSISSGHYIAYTKYPNGRWYECNDETITEKPDFNPEDSHQIRGTPYIVLLQRIEPAQEIIRLHTDLQNLRYTL
jgi:hypothetical protein